MRRSPPLLGAVGTLALRVLFVLLSLLIFLTFHLLLLLVLPTAQNCGKVCLCRRPGVGRARLHLRQLCPLTGVHPLPATAPPRSLSQVSRRQGEVSLKGSLWPLPGAFAARLREVPLHLPATRGGLEVSGFSASREGCQNLCSLSWMTR